MKAKSGTTRYRITGAGRSVPWVKLTSRSSSTGAKYRNGSYCYTTKREAETRADEQCVIEKTTGCACSPAACYDSKNACI